MDGTATVVARHERLNVQAVTQLERDALLVAYDNVVQVGTDQAGCFHQSSRRDSCNVRVGDECKVRANPYLPSFFRPENLLESVSNSRGA